ncbi:hypothetical protein CBM2631_A130045 [Cupriavidus taiwanensis]|nr:hypothetical protein CBM2591_A130038 [Cupriavidus taiwanensis]SOZ77280.1 hypothetical protein CBM2618_A140115 [Cupriavidus taiwanensis]SOZ82091.1 hypothetical protein CBM2621_A120113 [Cupriavidus taiwanensis]SPA10596.1 hypothetical protein CBM2631_A130045 [Cupriavidus taiwanensis]
MAGGIRQVQGRTIPRTSTRLDPGLQNQDPQCNDRMQLSCVSFCYGFNAWRVAIKVSAGAISRLCLPCQKLCVRRQETASRFSA